MAVSRRSVFVRAPFRFLAERLAQDSDFLEDARYVLQLDDDRYQRLATQLAATDAFLSRSDLVAIASEAMGEGSDEIAGIIYRVSKVIHDAEMNSSEAMDQLAEAITEKVESLEPQDRQKVIDRLRKLVAEPVGIAKQFKAGQLVNAIGAQLDSIRFICDIRPVFDQRRERIDGAVPLTILRLEYNQPAGDSAVVEVHVTEGQLADLAEKTANAKLKLQGIKELLTHQGVTIPKTKATISEDRE